MTDRTPAAMHLARNVPKSVSKSGELVELYSTPKALEFVAGCLDDAGVRDAVEKLKHLAKHPQDVYVVEVAKAALAALTGTQEVKRD